MFKYKLCVEDVKEMCSNNAGEFSYNDWKKL